MKKEQVKGWIGLAVAMLLSVYLGNLYRVNHFGMQFLCILICGIVSVPPLILYGYRQLGTAPAWLAMAASFPLMLNAAEDPATVLLTWTLCFGSPLAVTFFWPRRPRIKDLAFGALPMAGLIWLGGALGYCKLHFGSWDLFAITERINYRCGILIEEMERLYRSTYGEKHPGSIEDAFELIQSQNSAMGFYFLSLAVYGLVGCFFLGVFLADRSFPAKERWLGSWSALLPGRGIAMGYMLAYLLVLFFANGQAFLSWKAVFDLFGFFFVFAGIYRILLYFRRKNWNRVLQWGVVFLLFGLAFLTAGGALLSPYMILQFVGWWFVTSPRVAPTQEKK